MRVITVFNHKGGCGKTTTAINLAAALAAAKRKVLLVDLDPQAHSTVGCGIREDEVEFSTWHLMRGRPDDEKPLALPDIAWEVFEGFCLAPSGVGLATLEQTLAGTEGRESRLLHLLEETADRYDFVLIDCGPGLGILSANALVAATEVIVPVDLGFFSVYGLSKTLEAISLIREHTGRQPPVHVLATMYDTRAKTMRRTLAALKDQYGSAVLNSVIRFNVSLREAAAMGSPIGEFSPGCRGHQDYTALAQELMASGLQVEYEQQALRQAAETVREEKALDEKIELVYGVTLIDGGIRFVCHAPGATRVQVSGDFNQWSSADGDMLATDQADVWQKEVRVPRGRYAYRLIMDGRWVSDPANPYVESNPYGELNSVVEVP
jgi:chromosome partitioning protein